MIYGKDSIWKFLILFAIVLLAVLDIIFAAQNKVVMWINGVIIFAELGYLAYRLYRKWDGETLNDKACKNK